MTRATTRASIRPMNNRVNPTDIRTYGPSHAFDVGVRFGFAGVLIVGAVQIIGAIANHRVHLLSGVILYLGISAIAIFGLSVLLRPRIVVSDRGLTVVSYASTKHLRWNDITGFSVGSGYSGIWVHLSTGKILIANGVQKSNLMMWLKRPARADRVVAELNAELAQLIHSTY